MSKTISSRPTIYTSNPFRVLGMSVNSPSREIERRARALQARERLKNPGSNNGGAGTNAPAPPQVDSAYSEALTRLSIPERRLVDEFFWFWPMASGSDQLDDGPMAVDHTSLEDLLKLCEAELIADPSNIVAKHNLVIASHMLLFANEVGAKTGKGGQQQKDALQTWIACINTLIELLFSDEVENHLRSRIQEMNDPRLPLSALDDLVDMILIALANTHADEAFQFAISGKKKAARLHATLVSEILAEDVRAERLILEKVQPIRTRLGMLRDGFLGSIEDYSSFALERAESYLAQCDPEVIILRTLFPKNHSVCIAVDEEIARALGDWGRACGYRADNHQVGINVLNLAKLRSHSVRMDQALDKDIKELWNRHESGFQFLAPHFLCLPSEILPKLIEARKLFFRDDYAACDQALRHLLSGFPEQSLEHQVINYSLGFSIAYKAFDDLGEAFELANRMVPSLAAALIRRTRSGHYVSANTCLICNTSYTWDNYYEYEGKRYYICNSCVHRLNQEKQVKDDHLKKALREAAKRMSLAHSHAPYHPFIRAQISNLREIAQKSGLTLRLPDLNRTWPTTTMQSSSARQAAPDDSPGSKMSKTDQIILAIIILVIAGFMCRSCVFG